LSEQIIDFMRNLQSIYSFYLDAVSADTHTYQASPETLILPVVPYPVLCDLLKEAAAAFEKEETVVRIDHDVVIVGDLHGQILDLFRILKSFGRPPITKYLFLGDVVDRGEFSTETAVLLLTMKVLWPASVFMIRGNHEFAVMWQDGGFEGELESLYPGMEIAQEFQKAFAMMPLAAVVNRKVLCLHGGIGPSFKTVEAIGKLERPICTFQSDVVADILWSDPTMGIEEFGGSTRGVGHFFGEVAFERFLRDEQLELLIRGHQSEQEGFRYQLNGKVLTVFSASNYCNRMGNKAGIAIVRSTPGARVLPKSFPPIRWVFRRQATFVVSTDSNSVTIDPDQVAAIRAKARQLPLLIPARVSAVTSVYTPRPPPDKSRKLSKSLKQASAPIALPLGASSSVTVLPTLFIDQFSSVWRRRRSLLTEDM
jgi:protein phosphatase